MEINTANTVNASNLEPVENLTEVVFQLRRRSGLSRRELADLSGVGKTVIQKIESGSHHVRLDIVIRLLVALNASLWIRTPLPIEAPPPGGE